MRRIAKGATIARLVERGRSQEALALAINYTMKARITGVANEQTPSAPSTERNKR